jgi:hypothetical protein
MRSFQDIIRKDIQGGIGQPSRIAVEGSQKGYERLCETLPGGYQLKALSDRACKKVV